MKHYRPGLIWLVKENKEWEMKNQEPLESSRRREASACCWAACFGLTLCFPAVLRLKARASCALGQCFTSELQPQPFGFIFKDVNSLDLELAFMKPGAVGLPALWRLIRTLPGLHIYCDLLCIHFFTSQPSGWFRASGPSCWQRTAWCTHWQVEVACCIAAHDCHLVGLLSRSLATPALGKAVSRSDSMTFYFSAYHTSHKPWGPVRAQWEKNHQRIKMPNSRLSGLRTASGCCFSVFYCILSITPSVAALPEGRRGTDRML